jgi:hypothetical protein
MTSRSFRRRVRTALPLTARVQVVMQGIAPLSFLAAAIARIDSAQP